MSFDSDSNGNAAAIVIVSPSGEKKAVMENSCVSDENVKINSSGLSCSFATDKSIVLCSNSLTVCSTLSNGSTSSENCGDSDSSKTIPALENVSNENVMFSLCEATSEYCETDEEKQKRVNFPDDHDLVSGYVDAPDPWRNGLSYTTDQLIQSYKITCEKHGVKPIQTLFQQLQALEDFSTRHETLCLKGEKLDVKHCETLEEVFKRVQFRMLDLEASNLTDDSTAALCDMLEYYESATKLNISYNKNIGPRGWQACARMIKRTPCVEYLDTRCCSLNEQSLPMLGRTLRINNGLQILHMEACNLSGKPLMILVAALKQNQSLKELFLSDNKLSPLDGIQLGSMLRINHTLKLLDLRNNCLQDAGLSHLCDGISEQVKDTGLDTLVLWNNQITFVAMAQLGNTLANTKHIHTLNLGHNNITNEGIHQLKGFLILNKSLLRLGLQCIKITCEGAVALAEYIADNIRLERIDLRENEIKIGGLMALSLSAKVNKSITRIDLDKEPKKENIKDYAIQNKQLQEDISRFCKRNAEHQLELAEMKEKEEKEEEITTDEQQRGTVKEDVENLEPVSPREDLQLDLLALPRPPGLSSRSPMLELVVSEALPILQPPNVFQNEAKDDEGSFFLSNTLPFPNVVDLSLAAGDSVKSVSPILRKNDLVRTTGCVTVSRATCSPAVTSAPTFQKEKEKSSVKPVSILKNATPLSSVASTPPKTIASKSRFIVNRVIENLQPLIPKRANTKDEGSGDSEMKTSSSLENIVFKYNKESDSVDARIVHIDELTKDVTFGSKWNKLSKRSSSSSDTALSDVSYSKSVGKTVTGDTVCDLSTSVLPPSICRTVVTSSSHRVFVDSVMDTKSSAVSTTSSDFLKSGTVQDSPERASSSPVWTQGVDLSKNLDDDVDVGLFSQRRTLVDSTLLYDPDAESASDFEKELDEILLKLSNNGKTDTLFGQQSGITGTDVNNVSSCES